MTATSISRTPRPILGPGLWIGGVLLWAYVVAGEFIVGMELPEGVGALALLVSVGLASVFAIRQAALAVPADPSDRLFRIGGPIGIAVALFFAVLVLFTAIGQASDDGLGAEITLVLWCGSLVAFVAGRRLTNPDRSRTRQSGRTVGFFLWIAAGFLTLVALVRAAAEL